MGKEPKKRPECFHASTTSLLKESIRTIRFTSGNNVSQLAIPHDDAINRVGSLLQTARWNAVHGGLGTTKTGE